MCTNQSLCPSDNAVPLIQIHLQTGEGGNEGVCNITLDKQADQESEE